MAERAYAQRMRERTSQLHRGATTEQEELLSGQQSLPFTRDGGLHTRSMTPAMTLHLQRTVGNSAVRHMISAQSPTRAQLSVQRWLHAPGGHLQRDNWLDRTGRRMKRWFSGKALPGFTYRWDTRPAQTIANDGFQARDPNGNITLEEHVNNAFSPGHARAGQQAKHDSQWVSTGAYGMLKRLDPTFAQQVLNTNLYKINTALAAGTGNFKDVNDHFDRIGQDRPYASQREWAKLGGIPGTAVVEWMSGQTFFDQYDMTNGAPDQANLTGWRPMPAAQQPGG